MRSVILQTRKVRFFISFNHRDVATADLLMRSIAAKGQACWGYHNKLPYSSDIWTACKNQIHACDVFVVIISRHSKQSDWVAAELHEALLAAKNGTKELPIIAGVLIEDSPNRFLTAKEFGSSNPGLSYDFGNQRCLDITSPETNSVEAFIDSFLPRVDIFGQDEGDGFLVPQSYIACYESIFNEKVLRDDANNIRDFLNTSYYVHGRPWVYLFAGLTIAERCVGVAYLSYHAQTKLLFGSYLGVLHADRTRRTAKLFYDGLKDHMAATFPDNYGILFECDAYDPSLLDDINETISSGIKPTASQLVQVKNITRLGLFSSYGASCLLNDDGTPYLFRMPAMQEPLDESNEANLIIMFSGDSKRLADHFAINEVLAFLYENVYGDYYSERFTIGSIPSYGDYIYRLKEQAMKVSPSTLSFGKPLSGAAIRTWRLAAGNQTFLDLTKL